MLHSLFCEKNHGKVFKNIAKQIFAAMNQSVPKESRYFVQKHSAIRIPPNGADKTIKEHSIADKTIKEHSIADEINKES